MIIIYLLFLAVYFTSPAAYYNKKIKEKLLRPTEKSTAANPKTKGLPQKSALLLEEYINLKSVLCTFHVYYLFIACLK